MGDNMPTLLPYMPSNKNTETLFSKIHSAKIPDRFTHSFLQTTIGLKGTNDRQFIPLLRSLGFIDQSGAPTSKYKLLKSSETAKSSIAQAIRTAYAPLFEANESAHTLSGEKLKGLVAQVAGTDTDMTGRIVATFNALVKLADFSKKIEEKGTQDEQAKIDEAEPDAKSGSTDTGKPLRPEFHYNIQMHLPSNATEEVYINIFNALRKVFQ
jgi:hypothetical protein